MQDLHGKKVTVMGLGLHGGALGTVDWLVTQGAIVTVTDIKTKEQLQPTLAKLPSLDHVRLALGGHNAEDFTAADMIIRNPGVPSNSEWLTLAREHNVRIEMDSSLFFQNCLSFDIIGVTGSKGKTSVTQAIATILQEGWPKLQAVGVDGVSPLGKLKDITAKSLVVFELSSWRLEALAEKKISPAIAVVTSIYRDHLNTYDSFDSYVAMKKAIWQNQVPGDVVILNADDAIIRTWASEVPSHLWWYSINDLPEGNGIFVRSGNVIVRQDGQETTLIALDALAVQAEHQRRNVLPGILIGYLRGMRAEQLRAAVTKVTGLPHRLELVREFKGVNYINDSAATIPDATIAGLRSLASKSIIHIVGGSDKALLFTELAHAEATSSVRAIIWLPGTATEQMQADFKQAGVTAEMKPAASMEEAVQTAAAMAHPGEVVLMSPGATSFGLFLHEFDRGDKFRQAVMGLR